MFRKHLRKNYVNFVYKEEGKCYSLVVIFVQDYKKLINMTREFGKNNQTQGEKSRNKFTT